MQIQIPAKEVISLASDALARLDKSNGPGSVSQAIVVRRLYNCANAVPPQAKVTITDEDYQWLTEGAPQNERTQIRTKKSK